MDIYGREAISMPAPITAPLLWNQLIPALFNSILGHPLLVAGFGLMFFYLMGLGLRLTLEMQIIIMFFASMTIFWIYFPAIALFLYIGAGVFIGIFLIYNLFSR
jgi:hypothetical protein